MFKEWQTKRYPKEKLEEHDGNYALGTGDISGGIIVFDWDFRRGFDRKIQGLEEIYLKFKEEFPKLADTLVAETPHGYHFYYKLKGDKYRNTSSSNGGYDKKGFVGKNELKFGKWLAGLDTRANGGYVVIPPSVVNNEEYRWLVADEKGLEDKIIEITDQDYEAIFKWFKIEEKDVASNTIRQGFVNIFNGKINPNEYKAETGLDEQVYWREMFHEAYSCCGILPEDLFEGLQKFQKGFDLEETKKQLKNEKNREYVLNGKRLSSAKYEEYFQVSKVSEKEKEEIMETKEAELYLEGTGNVYVTDKGLFLLKHHAKTSELFRVLEGKLTIEKISYEYMNNNRILITGSHENKKFRTYPLSDLLLYLGDFIYQGNRGKDAVKFYIHSLKEQIPVYDLNYVLGFNGHWSLPWLEEPQKFQILTATDKQKEAYDKSQSMKKQYTEKETIEIKKLMQEFVSKTQMNETKLSIIIGWCMSAPFRSVFIDLFALFPILCAYGNRSTGKSTVLEFFCVKFYDIYENYDATRVLFSAARFENVLSMSSFPVFIQEVHTIPVEILSLMKEHATGISRYFRMKTARENDFNCLKSAPLSIDCNLLPKVLQDPAMNTKLATVQFTENDIIKLDPEWNALKNKLCEYKLFSLYYNHTKDWTVKDIENQIKVYMEEITDLIRENDSNLEKDNPRIVQQYVIIAFGIELFNALFDVNFDRKKILRVLLKSRTVITRSVLDDFYTYCEEALIYDSEAKNPSYLSHSLEEYKSRAKGEGWIFNAGNKVDFQRFTQEKYSLEELVEKLRDSLPENDKDAITLHNTGKTRGIFIREDFFMMVKRGEGKE